MNLHTVLPTGTFGRGARLRRTTQSSSQSTGRYQPSEDDFIKSFYAVLRRWQSETAFISDPDEITSHPSFEALVTNAKIVAPLIFSELYRGPSYLVWVLDDAFGIRPYSDGEVGNIEAMTNAWIAWGERNGREI